MLLFGASAFTWALVPAGLARELTGPLRRMTAAAIIAAAATAFAWLALEAGQMSEGWGDVVNPATLSAISFETAFGRVWLWRLALALALVAALAMDRHDRLAFIVPVSALLLASLGLVGHATIQPGLIGALHRANHSIHLLSAGAWLGGLAPLILCLRRYGDARLRAEVGAALRRYSGLGHFAVALVVLTGVVNIALTLGAWPIDFSTPYRALLLVKIALVAAMIAMALFNRYVLTPRIRNEPDAVLRALTINSVVEIALGMAVLALVSAFAILEPI
jgi:copper resistance protein D